MVSRIAPGGCLGIVCLFLVLSALVGRPGAAYGQGDTSITIEVSEPEARNESASGFANPTNRHAPNLWTSQQALARLVSEKNAYFLAAQREVNRTTMPLLDRREEALLRDLRNRQFAHGDSSRKEIALTFDDGPHAGYSDEILAILNRYHVPATFFVVGEQAEKYPDLVRQEVQDGHLIANHTYHHVSLPKIPQEYVASEIMACGNVIAAITGNAPRYFRPPGGEFNQGVALASAALGYTMVLWTDDPGDYASPGAEVILKRTLDKARPGGIILLHDGIAQTVDILPRLILTLKSQGYTFVRIDKMRRARAPFVPELPNRIKVAAR